MALPSQTPRSPLPKVLIYLGMVIGGAIGWQLRGLPGMAWGVLAGLVLVLLAISLVMWVEMTRELMAEQRKK